MQPTSGFEFAYDMRLKRMALVPRQDAAHKRGDVSIPAR